jgi:hypothetical protein
MLRRRDSPNGEGDWPDDPFEEPEPEPPPGPPAASEERQEQLKTSAQAWLAAVDHWQSGIEEFKTRRYASAVSAYTGMSELTDVFLALEYIVRDE